MVLLEFSMSPIDKGESLSKYVARSLEIIDKSGVDYRLNPMGTVLEGEWEDVIGVVTQCFNRMKEDCNRISLSIKVDYRKDKKERLKGRVINNLAFSTPLSHPLLSIIIPQKHRNSRLFRSFTKS